MEPPSNASPSPTLEALEAIALRKLTALAQAQTGQKPSPEAIAVAAKMMANKAMRLHLQAQAGAPTSPITTEVQP